MSCKPTPYWLIALSTVFEVEVPAKYSNFDHLNCSTITCSAALKTRLDGAALLKAWFWCSINRLASELIIKLLEVSHGQWLVHNLTVHNVIAGTIATKTKENLQLEVEHQHQKELGADGLLP